MRVRIIGCSGPDLWYSTQLGSEFNVVEHEEYPNDYIIEERYNVVTLAVSKQDCGIIEEENKPEKMKIVQISADNNCGVYALCADGSLWYSYGSGGNEWIEKEGPVRL